MDSIELINTLDLCEVVKKTKQTCLDSVVLPSVFAKENDLILTLSADCHFNTSIINIKLKNALLDNWYQKLDIFFEKFIPKNIIAMDDDVWILAETPLIFTDNKKIIMITHQDIGENAELIILKNIGNYSFFRNEADLILTNIFTETDYFTFIANQFYQRVEMREKMLSAKLSFFDQSIQPKNHQEAINQAANFSDIVYSHSTSVDKPVTQLDATNSTPANAPDTTHPPPQEKSRNKRHVNLEKQKEKPISVIDFQSVKLLRLADYSQDMINQSRRTSPIVKKDRILAMADYFLEEHETKQKSQRKHRKRKAQQKKQALHEKQSPVKKHLVQRKQTHLGKQLPQEKKTSCYHEEKFFKNSHLQKINFFQSSKNFQHQNSHSLSTKTNKVPQLTPQQENFSGTNNRNSFSRVTARVDFPGALMLLQLAAQKSHGKSHSTIFFDKKTTKKAKKVERQTDTLSAKIFGIPKLETIKAL